MTDRHPQGSIVELEQALHSVAATLDYPPVPAVAASVRDQIERAPQRGRRRVWLPRPAVVFATLALVVLAAAAMLFSPAARNAVADLLGLRGVDIERTESPPPSPPDPSGPLIGYVDAGERVSLEEARRRLDFKIRVPDQAVLGAPDEVYVDDHPSGGRATFVYRAAPNLPRIRGFGAGLVMSQFRAEIYEEWVGKLAGQNTSVEPLSVNGGRGYWIEGDHLFYLYDIDGQIIEDSQRLADSALVWEEGEVTLRIESSLTKAEALRIAESSR